MGSNWMTCVKSGDSDESNHDFSRFRTEETISEIVATSTEASESPVVEENHGSTPRKFAKKKKNWSGKRVRRRRKMRSQSIKNRVEELQEVEFIDSEPMPEPETKPEVDLNTMSSLPTSITMPDPRVVTKDNPNFIFFQEAHKNSENMLELMKDKQIWKLSKNKKDVKLYKLNTKLKPSECFIMRTVEIRAPKRKVVSLFEDSEFQLATNNKLKSLDLISQITSNASITHQVSKGWLIVKGRDFYTFANKYDLNPTTTLISNHSIENADFPAISWVTRGEVRGIFWFEELDNSSTRITNIMNIDLKGSVGTFISNKVADAQHDSFLNLKKNMEEILTPNH